MAVSTICKVFITVDGLENVVLGRSMYSWHYYVCEEGQEPSEDQGYTLIATFKDRKDKLLSLPCSV